MASPVCRPPGYIQWREAAISSRSSWFSLSIQYLPFVFCARFFCTFPGLHTLLTNSLMGRQWCPYPHFTTGYMHIPACSVRSGCFQLMPQEAWATESWIFTSRMTSQMKLLLTRGLMKRLCLAGTFIGLPCHPGWMNRFPENRSSFWRFGNLDAGPLKPFLMPVIQAGRWRGRQD